MNLTPQKLKDITAVAQQAEQMAKATADATQNAEVRTLALAVFALARALQDLSDSTPSPAPSREPKHLPATSQDQEKPPMRVDT